MVEQRGRAVSASGLKRLADVSRSTGIDLRLTLQIMRICNGGTNARPLWVSRGIKYVDVLCIPGASVVGPALNLLCLPGIRWWFVTSLRSSELPGTCPAKLSQPCAGSKFIQSEPPIRFISCLSSSKQIFQPLSLSCYNVSFGIDGCIFSLFC